MNFVFHFIIFLNLFTVNQQVTMLLKSPCGENQAVNVVYMSMWGF